MPASTYSRNPLVVIFFFFLMLFLFVKFVGPIPFSVSSITTTKDNLFSVTGTGEIKSVPTTATATFGITKQGSNAQQLQSDSNTVINKITDELKKIGVDQNDIKTSNYSVNPNYNYTNGKQQIDGYTSTQTLEVKLRDQSKANQAVDIATKNGANQVGNISFTADDSDKQKLEDQARVAAIKDAKTKAESLAKLAGITLVRIVDIQESSPNQPRPLNYAADLKAVGNQVESTQLNPGENTTSITVTLSYETR